MPGPCPPRIPSHHSREEPRLLGFLLLGPAVGCLELGISYFRQLREEESLYDTKKVVDNIIGGFYIKYLEK
jgi:hypothetical protein